MSHKHGRSLENSAYKLTVQELRIKLSEAVAEEDKQFYENWLNFRLKRGYYARSNNHENKQ
jgi:hypothetical protein